MNSHEKRPRGGDTPNAAGNIGHKDCTTRPTQGQSLLPFAIEYARRGWRIHPLRSCDKIPLLDRWPEVGSTDENQLVEWWTRTPTANIGLVCGRGSGVLVIDVDPRHDGDNGLARLEDRLGKLPPTVTSKTGGGGRHLFFKHPGGDGITNAAGFAGVGGVDIRTGGGNIVLPPSRHPSGGTYEWVGETEHLAELPPRWIDELTNKPSLNAGPVFQVGATGEEALIRECASVLLKTAVPPNEQDGSNRLYSCACRSVEYGLSDVSAIRAIRAYEVAAPFPKQWSDDEIIRRIRDAEKKVTRGASSKTGKERSSPQALIRRLADVEPESVSWLWPLRIPLGMLTILIGDPCVGKSFIVYDIAARVSTGSPWPDARDVVNIAGDVILLTAEDGLADTVRPRIDAAGGDVARIAALDGIRYGDDGARLPFKLDRDLSILDRLLRESSVRLVTIDPLSAYLGDANSYKDADVRAVLAPVADLAERHRVAILAVMHLGKDSGRKAMYRANGSIAFTAAPRAVWAVGCDPDDPERRIVVNVKMNIARPALGIAYKIQDGAVAWDAEPVDVSADQLLGPGDDAEATEDRIDAAKLLLELLADGPMQAKDIIAAAKRAGIGPKALRRGGKRIGVQHIKVGKPGEKQHWEWRLPPKMPGEPPKIPKMPIQDEGTSSAPSGIFGDDEFEAQKRKLIDVNAARGGGEAA